ncbi:MAG: alpha/beta fold hydrolase [Aminipila sp.]
MPYFKYKNKSCYYETYGKGEPVIFLHGNTASSKMFSSLVESFSQVFEVILMDFLGHGKSDRVEGFATDLWYDEALQVIAFIEQAGYQKVNIIGSSGGALVAINVALEHPDLVNKVIADSFEGEEPFQAFVENVVTDRDASKKDENAKAFYYMMHGEDWESVVDNDTKAIFEHSKTIGKFFHKELSELASPILLTGSREDEFVKLINPDFYNTLFSNLIGKIGHGQMHIFQTGGHPALLSNQKQFSMLAIEFIKTNL